MYVLYEWSVMTKTLDLPMGVWNEEMIFYVGRTIKQISETLCTVCILYIIYVYIKRINIIYFFADF